MRALALVALLGSGCSAVLNFDECTTDDECSAKIDGGVGFCSSDHLCLSQVPEERLCTELIGADPNDPNTVMLGGLFRLSGMAGDKDTEMANAARMAMKEIIGTNQRQIGMVMCDVAIGGGADKTVADRSLIRAATKYHVVGAVGPTTSGNMLAVANSAVQYDVLLVTPSATSPAISGLPDNNLIWRTCASDALQGNILANYIPLMTGTPTPHASKVNTAYVDSAYGQGLNNAFSSEWTKKSGTGPISTTQFETPANTDMVVMRLAQDNPDFSVLVADDDASNMMKSLYAHGSLFNAGAQFLFTDGALGPNFIGMTPDVNICKRVFGTAPATPAATTPPGLNFTTFSNAYKDQFMGSDPATTSFVANTYDATYVVALVAAGVPVGQQVTGDQMAALMMRMSSGQKVNVGPVDFVQGVRTLRGGGTVDFVGSSGELTWNDATGDPTDSPIEVWGIDTTLSPPDICIMQPTSQKTCP